MTHLHKSVRIVLIAAFAISGLNIPQVIAGELVVAPMPKPGAMVGLSPAFAPAHLQGMTIHADNALQFDFLVNKGDEHLDGAQEQVEYKKLVKYFLASLTIPNNNQWVNLSPYEHNRIIEDNFGKTEMGRDLLAQDYLLKQITSSLMYPESGLGKSFWDKVYAEAWKEYHTTNVPVNTFNKVWIMPDEAAVYESGNTVYVLKSHLKVMLEEDYLALKKNVVLSEAKDLNKNNPHTIASKVIREIILPALEKEVNEGKNFAQLRQAVSGMVLATWYKRALKESLLGKVYANKDKVQGVNLADPKNNEAIYQQYLEAFKKGAYNYVKDDVDSGTNQTIPRKYFSGGVVGLADKRLLVITPGTAAGHTADIDTAMRAASSDMAQVNVNLKPAAQAGADAAMVMVFNNPDFWEHWAVQFLTGAKVTNLNVNEWKITMHYRAASEKIRANIRVLLQVLEKKDYIKRFSITHDDIIITVGGKDFSTEQISGRLLRNIIRIAISVPTAWGTDASVSYLLRTASWEIAHGYYKWAGFNVTTATIGVGVIATFLSGIWFANGEARDDEAMVIPAFQQKAAAEETDLAMGYLRAMQTASLGSNVSRVTVHLPALPAMSGDRLRSVLSALQTKGLIRDPAMTGDTITFIVNISKVDLDAALISNQTKARINKILSAVEGLLITGVPGSLLFYESWELLKIDDYIGTAVAGLMGIAFLVTGIIILKQNWKNDGPDGDPGARESLPERPTADIVDLAAERAKREKPVALPEQAADDRRVASGDKAMPGGIDVNADHMKFVDFKRDGKGVPLPFSQQDIAQLNLLPGFEPQILEIKTLAVVPILSELRQKLDESQKQLAGAV